MPSRDDLLRDLRTAVERSPKKISLRQRYADTLLKFGLLDEAEKEYRTALAFAPNNSILKIGLADTFIQQEKHSQALVIIEELIKDPNVPPRIYLLYSRLLFIEGEVRESRKEYRRALAIDPALKDPALEERLGVNRPRSVVGGRIRDYAEDEPVSPEINLEQPLLTFEDVGGMEKLKEEIRIKIIHPLTHAKIYQAYGKQIGGGILMYGPPGCGKTYLARATAGEVKAGFIAVGINDVLDMWVGQSEKNLHELFQHARNHRPCVLFFDEVDALGASRADMRKNSGRQLINQFLSELDGIKNTNDGVLILAATNAPWHLDSAFRRPGRFDRVLFVPPPDTSARAEIFKILLKNKPQEDVDYRHLAKKTEGFSGADLKAIIDIAVEEKLRQAIKQGLPEPLTTKDLLAAANSLKPTTKDWFATARNYALYANQGGIYDDIRAYLKI